MSGISKRVSGSWVSGDYGIMKTATDTITTLPADLYADGNNATVGIVGNMSQTGTPTPQNPIQPSECGDLETTGEHAGQYKIPILSNSTTTPVYLGEVQTTRKIRKLVLTGEEEWENVNPSPTNRYFRMIIGNMDSVIADMVISTHYTQTSINSSNTDNGVNVVNSSSVDKAILLIRPYNVEDIDLLGWQNYLRQQYANGTPVTVWYVLATPTTGIVNEPIRKIGDYADTVSGITVPTITGKDTFDVQTTLKPSEVSLAYTGWHDATVREKSRNLFDYTTVTFGKYISASGEEATSSGTGEQSLNHSDYIPVNAGITYTFKCDKSPIESATFNAFCWFDSNKQFIDRAVFDVGAIDPYILGTATAPINAAYLIMNYRGLHGDTAMLNLGSTALPYEPYWK